MEAIIDLTGFQNGFKGTLLQPGDGNYDQKKIWNSMIDCKPALIKL